MGNRHFQFPIFLESISGHCSLSAQALLCFVVVYTLCSKRSVSKRKHNHLALASPPFGMACYDNKGQPISRKINLRFKTFEWKQEGFPIEFQNDVYPWYLSFLTHIREAVQHYFADFALGIKNSSRNQFQTVSKGDEICVLDQKGISNS